MTLLRTFIAFLAIVTFLAIVSQQKERDTTRPLPNHFHCACCRHKIPLPGGQEIDSQEEMDRARVIYQPGVPKSGSVEGFPSAPMAPKLEMMNCLDSSNGRKSRR